MKLPSRLTRLRLTLSSPGYARAALLRRILSIALLCAAAVVALLGRRENPEVAVFAHDVAAGSVLTAADVDTRTFPASQIPAAIRVGGSTTVDDLVGRVVVAAGSEGEVITESRLLGPTLTSQIVSENTQDFSLGPPHMVPLQLAEPEIAALLHHGDTVDIVTAVDSNARSDARADARADAADTADPAGAASAAGVAADAHESATQGGLAGDSGGQSSLIATGARVITTNTAGKDSAGSGNASILIALPAAKAQKVASASLSMPLTVVITGERATVGAGGQEQRNQ